MAKYATMTVDGVVTAFYDEAFHGPRYLDGGGPNPDTRIPGDAVELTDEIYATWSVNTRTLRYVDGALVAYVRPPTIPSIDEVRRKRNGLLADSDWTQLPDVPLSTEAREAWAAYRQALRDLPELLPVPLTAAPTWPTPPT